MPPVRLQQQDEETRGQSLGPMIIDDELLFATRQRSNSAPRTSLDIVDFSLSHHNHLHPLAFPWSASNDVVNP